MKLILGSMTFGEQVEDSEARSLLRDFRAAGHAEVDTAHVYCDGRSEEMLGKLLPADAADSPPIASKVNPWNDNGLQPAEIRRQFSESLSRLGRDSIDLLYLHSPDLDTPIADTLEACYALYRDGGFRRFGLSNYAAWQVAEIAELCRRHGWMQPQVYQGMYNALTRDVERELFPCLRHYDMAFYAYNPLAGGLLTGKHSSAQEHADEGRFVRRSNYLERYWKAEYFAVLDELRAACEGRDLTLLQVAFAWLQHHSMLREDQGDGIILGASSVAHLDQNMAACASKPLDDELLEILDRGWDAIRPNCFRYFRP